MLRDWKKIHSLIMIEKNPHEFFISKTNSIALVIK